MECIAQDLDHALKQLQSQASSAAVLFLSPDPDRGQVLCLAKVPEVADCMQSQFWSSTIVLSLQVFPVQITAFGEYGIFSN